MPSSFLSKDSSGLHACCILFVATAIVCATVATARAEAASQQFGAAGEASGPLLRLRRQAAATHQQQVEQDELMKRQLPDLIAQAHDDKLAERALLKLIIDASLRSGLGTIVAAQQQQQVAPGRAGRPLAPAAGGWQLASVDELPALAGDGGAELAQQYQQQYPSHGRLVRLDLGEQYADAANGAGPYGSLPQQQQQQTAMDKREYIKPCSFNAISCVRTPFRKL